MRKLALNLRREVSPSKFDKIIISGGASPESPPGAAAQVFNGLQAVGEQCVGLGLDSKKLD